MQWIIRFCAAGTAVTLSWIVGRRLGLHAGGMVLAFPFVIGSGLIFATGSGSRTFTQVTTGVLWGLGPLALLAVTVLLVSRHTPPPLALAAGAVAWLGSAGVPQWLR